MKTQYSITFVCLILTLILAACGGPAPAQSQPTQVSASPFEIIVAEAGWHKLFVPRLGIEFWIADQHFNQITETDWLAIEFKDLEEPVQPPVWPVYAPMDSSQHIGNLTRMFATITSEPDYVATQVFGAQTPQGGDIGTVVAATEETYAPTAWALTSQAPGGQQPAPSLEPTAMMVPTATMQIVHAQEGPSEKPPSQVPAPPSGEPPTIPVGIYDAGNEPVWLEFNKHASGQEWLLVTVHNWVDPSQSRSTIFPKSADKKDIVKWLSGLTDTIFYPTAGLPQGICSSCFITENQNTFQAQLADWTAIQQFQAQNNLKDGSSFGWYKLTPYDDSIAVEVVVRQLNLGLSERAVNGTIRGIVKMVDMANAVGILTDPNAEAPYQVAFYFVGSCAAGFAAQGSDCDVVVNFTIPPGGDLSPAFQLQKLINENIREIAEATGLVDSGLTYLNVLIQINSGMGGDISPLMGVVPLDSYALDADQYMNLPKAPPWENDSPGG